MAGPVESRESGQAVQHQQQNEEYQEAVRQIAAYFEETCALPVEED